MFRIGIFLSITYFIVIPIIPDRKLQNIVIAIKIPVLAPSPTFKVVETATPSDKLAKAPTSESNITNGKLLP